MVLSSNQKQSQPNQIQSKERQTWARRGVVRPWGVGGHIRIWHHRHILVAPAIMRIVFYPSLLLLFFMLCLLLLSFFKSEFIKNNRRCHFAIFFFFYLSLLQKQTSANVASCSGILAYVMLKHSFSVPVPLKSQIASLTKEQKCEYVILKQNFHVLQMTSW